MNPVIQNNPQKTANDYFNQGNQCKQSEQYQDAVEAYEKAIELNPNFSWYYHNLAEVFFELEEWEKSSNYFQKACEINQNSEWSFYQLGEVLVQQGELEEAIAAFQTAIELNPGYAEFYSSLGEVLWQAERLEEAENTLQKAVEIEPYSIKAYQYLWEVLAKQGKGDQGLVYLQKAVELNHSSWELHQKLGEVWHSKRDLVAAEKQYKTVIQLKSDYHWGYYKLGVILREQGKVEEAIASLQKAVELEASSAICHHYLGHSLAVLQKWDEAIECYQKAIELAPESAIIYQHLGDALSSLGQWNEAVIEYRKGVELDPNSLEGQHHLGYALHQLQQWDAAITCYRKALEISPNSDVVNHHLGDAFGQRSKTHINIQQVELDINEAIVYYCRAIELQPNNYEKLVYKILELQPNRLENVSNDLISSYSTYYEKSQKLIKEENWSEAILSYKQSFYSNPKIARTWLHNCLGGYSINYGSLRKTFRDYSRIEYNLPKVTIVIPIYNAYEDIKLCLDSVLKHTQSLNGDAVDILLIDDASSDQRVTEFLSQICHRFSLRVRLHKNSHNFGFVKSCNLAFEISNDKDIILLNSDTIVTARWLEKLSRAAYSNGQISSVTPLTNNGEICSVPSWLQNNEIPQGYTIDSFAELVENISFYRYPTIPTAVGFCMYIKREALDEVGGFDEASFGRGYGEENDWSFRASKRGYYHIIDDSTFVYHSGGKSFGTEQKKSLALANFKPLEALHPDYHQVIHQFIDAKPYQDVISNIQLHLKLEEIRQQSPVCFILHNATDIPVNGSLGGTEFHCDALISVISQGRPVYTLFFNNQEEGSLVLTIFLKTEKLKFEFPVPRSNRSELNYQSYKFRKWFIGILQYFQPSLIHIHHLMNLPILDIVESVKKLKIPYLLSIHDYYLICPSFNLIDWKNQFCYEHKNEQYCQKCIQSLFNQGENIKQKWYKTCQELLSSSVGIITPSDTARSYFTREYPELTDKIKVIRHGVFPQYVLDEKLKYRSEKIYLKSKNKPINIAFVGGIHIIKGLELIIEMMEIVQSKEELKVLFNFELYGQTQYPIPEHIQILKIKGRYEKKDLPKLLNSVDVVVLPTIWPETYCLVADEVLALGIPVITTPLGAVAERVTRYKIGWVTQSVSVKAILEVLINLAKHPEELSSVTENLKNYSIISYETMAQEYLYEYEKHTANSEKLSTIYSQDVTVSLQSIFLAHLKTKWSELS
ncbi:MAG: tetratricopeptide repeat protein [Microcoleaceae cyanobacterium]